MPSGGLGECSDAGGPGGALMLQGARRMLRCAGGTGDALMLGLGECSDALGARGVLSCPRGSRTGVLSGTGPGASPPQKRTLFPYFSKPPLPHAPPHHAPSAQIKGREPEDLVRAWQVELVRMLQPCSAVCAEPLQACAATCVKPLPPLPRGAEQPCSERCAVPLRGAERQRASVVRSFAVRRGCTQFVLDVNEADVDAVLAELAQVWGRGIVGVRGSWRRRMAQGGKGAVIGREGLKGARRVPRPAAYTNGALRLRACKWIRLANESDVCGHTDFCKHTHVCEHHARRRGAHIDVCAHSDICSSTHARTHAHTHARLCRSSPIPIAHARQGVLGATGSAAVGVRYPPPAPPPSAATVAEQLPAGSVGTALLSLFAHGSPRAASMTLQDGRANGRGNGDGSDDRNGDSGPPAVLTVWPPVAELPMPACTPTEAALLLSGPVPPGCSFLARHSAAGYLAVRQVAQGTAASAAPASRGGGPVAVALCYASPPWPGTVRFEVVDDATGRLGACHAAQLLLPSGAAAAELLAIAGAPPAVHPRSTDPRLGAAAATVGCDAAPVAAAAAAGMAALPAALDEAGGHAAGAATSLTALLPAAPHPVLLDVGVVLDVLAVLRMHGGAAVGSPMRSDAARAHVALAGLCRLVRACALSDMLAAVEEQARSLGGDGGSGDGGSGGACASAGGGGVGGGTGGAGASSGGDVGTMDRRPSKPFPADSCRQLPTAADSHPSCAATTRLVALSSAASADAADMRSPACAAPRAPPAMGPLATVRWSAEERFTVCRVLLQAAACVLRAPHGAPHFAVYFLPDLLFVALLAVRAWAPLPAAAARAAAAVHACASARFGTLAAVHRIAAYLLFAAGVPRATSALAALPVELLVLVSLAGSAFTWVPYPIERPAVAALAAAAHGAAFTAWQRSLGAHAWFQCGAAVGAGAAVAGLWPHARRRWQRAAPSVPPASARKSGARAADGGGL
eukprot:363514-Chlamydomonas_euryale.AAC.2